MEPQEIQDKYIDELRKHYPHITNAQWESVFITNKVHQAALSVMNSLAMQETKDIAIGFSEFMRVREKKDSVYWEGWAKYEDGLGYINSVGEYHLIDDLYNLYLSTLPSPSKE